MQVAVLEDDSDQAAFVTQVLEAAGHRCTRFHSGRQLMVRLRQDTFDLLILDWNVPEPTGLEVTAWVRDNIAQHIPILMITSRADTSDAVEGLNAGADDFLVKPLDASVLLARVQALLRRAYPPEANAAKQESFGDVTFDPFHLMVERAGQRVQLTQKEFALALAFFRNLHRPLGRAYLLETVWGRNPNLPTRTLDSHVSRIRSKLNLRPESGFRLAPVYSYGYRLERTDGA
jgi:DNA-binding response OmpR family regulator